MHGAIARWHILQVCFPLLCYVARRVSLNGADGRTTERERRRQKIERSMAGRRKSVADLRRTVLERRWPDGGTRSAKAERRSTGDEARTAKRVDFERALCFSRF